MKAKEYYAKYGERIASEDKDVSMQATQELIKDLLTDANTLIEKRQPKTDKAFTAIIDEINGKWNVICEMFNPPILRRNGWKTWFIMEVTRRGSV